MISAKRLLTAPLRVLTTFAAIGSLLVCMAFMPACPKSEKDRNLAFARDISGSFRAVSSLILLSHPALAEKLQRAADRADHLISAIEASNGTEIAAIVRDILPVFTDIAKQFRGSQNVLLALALGQIALNFFVNHFLSTASQRASKVGIAADRETIDSIQEFKALPQFGCQLKPEKCK